MNYEQKYKEALAWVESIYPELNHEHQMEAETIFPELAESEDERIREALIRFHKSTIDIDGIKGEDIIAWLEKQSENHIEENLEMVKPAWSEEDEKRFQSCLNILQVQAKGFMGITETINTKWLKSLKQRIGG